MGLDILKNMTDNEKKAVFNTAIEQAELTGKPFEEVIVEVVKAFIEERQQIQAQAWEQAEMLAGMDAPIKEDVDDFADPFAEEVPTEEVNNDFADPFAEDVPEQVENFEAPAMDDWDTPVGSEDDSSNEWEEEQSVDETFDVPTMTGVIAGFFDTFDDDVLEASQGVQWGDPKSQIIDDAKKGRITDYAKYFGTIAKSVIPGLSIAAAFIDIIKKINSAARGAYYAHVKHASDEVMDAERLAAVAAWEELGQNGLDFEHTLTQQDWDRHASATISFDILVDMNGDNYGRSKSGLNTIVGAEGPTSFDPTFYDDTFETARNIVGNHDKSSFVGKVFKEAMGAISSKVERLKGMTAAEYRAEKLGQMKLQPGEAELFDHQIQDFTQNKAQEWTDDTFEPRSR